MAMAMGLGRAAGLGTACVGAAGFATVCAVADGPATAGTEAWMPILAVTGSYLLTAALGALAHNFLRASAVLETAQNDRLEAAVGESMERERLLRHAMRVDTVGDLAGLVAHQLRNHFQVVMGDAALGSRDHPEQKDQRFRKILAEISQSSLLLERLLDLAHPDDGSARRTDLVHLCSRFTENLRSILPAAIEIRSQLPDGTVFVHLDPRGLEHTLLNLAINARHALRAGGTLSLGLVCDAGEAEIAVADDGVGIPPEDLDRIFEPYFTTRPQGEGTGLGLAAVERYVRAFEGSVRVDSRVGEGTTFKLRFPLAAEESGPIEKAIG